MARGAFDAAVKTSLVFIEVYYTNLPENIARRLTHIDGDAARELVSRLNTLEGEMLRAYVEKVASAEALALRQQRETADHVRELISLERASRSPKKGPFAS